MLLRQRHHNKVLFEFWSNKYVELTGLPLQVMKLSTKRNKKVIQLVDLIGVGIFCEENERHFEIDMYRKDISTW